MSAPPQTSGATPLFTGALLGIIEDAGVGVLTLTEDLGESELLQSRLTRAEVARQLLRMADSAAQMPASSRQGLSEIDWACWEATGRALRLDGTRQNDALWFAVRSLVPATVMWLRVYRQEQPGHFSMNL